MKMHDTGTDHLHDKDSVDHEHDKKTIDKSKHEYKKNDDSPLKAPKDENADQ